MAYVLPADPDPDDPYACTRQEYRAPSLNPLCSTQPTTLDRYTVALSGVS